MVDKENSLKDPIKKDGDGNDFSLDSWEQYFDKTFLLHIRVSFFSIGFFHSSNPMITQFTQLTKLAQLLQIAQ